MTDLVSRRTSSLSPSVSEDGEVWEGSTVVTTLSSTGCEGWESSAVGGAREGRNGKLGRAELSAGTVGDAGGEK